LLPWKGRFQVSTSMTAQDEDLGNLGYPYL